MEDKPKMTGPEIRRTGCSAGRTGSAATGGDWWASCPGIDRQRWRPGRNRDGLTLAHQGRPRTGTGPVS